jgi:hypothetical protein
VQTGNGTYKLKPVIKIIPFVLNGIEGFVDTALLNSHVVVSAQMDGDIVRATVPNTVTGKFFLARLDPTNCTTTCYDVVITADGHATAVIAAVPVASTTSITTISTSTASFTLQPSNSQSVNGTVTLSSPDDDGTVIVAAKQTLVSVPPVTVTVKSQVAPVIPNDPAGDYGYNLTLPIGAPSLATYGALPITPTAAAQSTVAKMYIVQGSALVGTTVYANQTPPASTVDITAVPTQDFSLKP